MAEHPEPGARLDIAAFQADLRAFVRARDWEQFHDPKSLAMSLAIEAGELMEIFQWVRTQDAAGVMADARRAAAVREEMADVLAYLLRLADVLAVDLPGALRDKLVKNAGKYPVHLARGNARKYSEFAADVPPAGSGGGLTDGNASE